VNRALAKAIRMQGYEARWERLPFATHDHQPFARAGIPATTLTSGELGTDLLARFIAKLFKLPVGGFKRYPYSHADEDSLDKIQLNAIERGGRITIGLARLAESG
jgi:Zn-dependent M28 family amino/carboxypeptidase